MRLLLLVACVCLTASLQKVPPKGSKRKDLRPHVAVRDIKKPDTCPRSIDKEDYVSMHYIGSIDESSESGTPGKIFDRTIKNPFEFQVAKDGIPGWSLGMMGMCVGQKAFLIIPPQLGFGNRNFTFPGAVVPPNATLKYEVEVMDISYEPGPPHNLFAEIDDNGDGNVTKTEAFIHFERHGRDRIPEGFWEHADKDGDDVVTWEEFEGPKGDVPPSKEEL